MAHHHLPHHPQSQLQPPSSMPVLSPSQHHPNGIPHRPSVPPAHSTEALKSLAQANEKTWLLIGNIAEQMQDPDRAESAYEHALRHNPESITALTQVASIARARDDSVKAIEFFQRALDLRQDNGEVWSALGHCYLMQDDLQKAYAAYQQALYYLTNPKDPKLWYGIGILYDRYGSLEHAEEAFASVLRMDENFEKADEIHFRLGIIYKQQGKYPESLDCFDRILRNPPTPLANVDIWFQIGHVYEQQKDYNQAKAAYERVLHENPNHAKVLQQLGWLYHQSGSSFQNQDMAIQCLTKSLEADGSDAQSWYLLGRAYMAVQKYQKAYEAYQQAVYRDGRNPTFWCSIGVLYYNINQYRDALDAYSRAIRINPYIPEVWFDLGSLYESCNNQISDAIDAYARAADLDPNNQLIKQRLRLLKDVQANGGQMPAAPFPQDVHPTAYASGHGPPTMIIGGHSSHASSSQQPPHSGPPSGPANLHRSDSRGPMNGLPSTPAGEHHRMGGRDLPAPPPPLGHARRTSGEMYRQDGAEPFRGGPPPPLNLAAEDSGGGRRISGGHAPLAPMDVDRLPHHGGSHYPSDRPRTSGPSSSGGPPQSLLLHHPQPQPPTQPLSSMQPPSGPLHHQPFPPRQPYDSQPPHDVPRRSSPPSESPRSNVGGHGRHANTAPSPSPSYHPGPGYGSRSFSSSTNPSLPPPTQSSHFGLPYDRPNAGDRPEGPWDRRHGHVKSESRGGQSEMGGPPHYPSRSPAPPQGSAPHQPTNYHPPQQHRGPPPPPQQHHGQPMYDRRPPSPGHHRGGPPPLPPNADHPSDRRDNRSPYPSSYSGYYGHQGPPPSSQHPHPHHPRHHSPHRPPSVGPPPRRYDPRMDTETARGREWERDDPPPLPPPQSHPPTHHEPSLPPSDRSAPERGYDATPDSAQQTRGRPMSAAANNIPEPTPKWGREPDPRSWRRDSESPRPGSVRPPASATAEPPKERKRRGKAGATDKDSEAGGSGKPVKEKKERKAPAKRGAAAAAAAAAKAQTEKEEQDRIAAVVSQASPPRDWSRRPEGPPSVQRPTRSVDEDYDEEGQEPENEGASAADALMGLAGYRAPAPVPPAPVPQRQSSGRLEALLNGPSSQAGPAPPNRSPPNSQRAPSRSVMDRIRSPPRTATPLKRVATDEHEDIGEAKRSRVSGNQDSGMVSPPAHMQGMFSNGNRTSDRPPVSSRSHDTSSRRPSIDVNGNSSRRSGNWGDKNMEVDIPPVHVSGATTSPILAKPPTASPHNSLPPIATLSPSPPSPRERNGRSGSASLTPMSDDTTRPGAGGSEDRKAVIPSPKTSSPKQVAGSDAASTSSAPIPS